MPVYIPAFKIDALSKQREGKESRELREKMDVRSLEMLEPLIARVLGDGDPAWVEIASGFGAYLNSFGTGATHPRSVTIDRGDKPPIRVYFDKAAYLADEHPMSVEASHMVAFRVGEHPSFRQWVKA